MTKTSTEWIRRTVLAGLSAVLSAAQAQEADEVTALTNPSGGSINLGIGYVSKDNGRFGQYNGLNEKGAYGILDFDWTQRNDGTGTFRIAAPRERSATAHSTERRALESGSA